LVDEEKEIEDHTAMEMEEMKTYADKT